MYIFNLEEVEEDYEIKLMLYMDFIEELESALNGRNALALYTLKRWNGLTKGCLQQNNRQSLRDFIREIFSCCDYFPTAYIEKGKLFLESQHHDGYVCIELRAIKDSPLQHCPKSRRTLCRYTSSLVPYYRERR